MEASGASPLNVVGCDWICIAQMCASNSRSIPGNKENPMSQDRLYVVRLLWVRDADLFADYQEQTKPILVRHGVHVERWLMTEAIEGEGMDKPDQIVVTWFANSDARKAFENDPEFKKTSKIRDKAAKLVSVIGKSGFGD